MPAAARGRASGCRGGAENQAKKVSMTIPGSGTRARCDVAGSRLVPCGIGAKAAWVVAGEGGRNLVRAVLACRMDEVACTVHDLVDTWRPVRARMMLRRGIRPGGHDIHQGDQTRWRHRAGYWECLYRQSLPVPPAMFAGDGVDVALRGRRASARPRCPVNHRHADCVLPEWLQRTWRYSSHLPPIIELRTSPRVAGVGLPVRTRACRRCRAARRSRATRRCRTDRAC